MSRYRLRCCALTDENPPLAWWEVLDCAGTPERLIVCVASELCGLAIVAELNTLADQLEAR